MGCSCKKDSNVNDNEIDLTIEMGFIRKVAFFLLKIFGFFLFILALPIINIAMIYLMFNTIVLNKMIDLKPLFVRLIKVLTPKNGEEEYYYGDDELTEDDFELVGVEDVKEEK